MGLDAKKTTGTTYNPVWLKILEERIGGGYIATGRVPSATKELKAGTLLKESTATAGIFHFVKIGKSVKTQAAATAIAISNKHDFAVGDFAILHGKTTAATINRVSNASVNTSVIATARALGTLATATYLDEANAAGATPLKLDPGSALKHNIRVRNDDLSTVNNVFAGVVYRGALNESILPYYVTSRAKTKLTARIRFE